MTWSRVPTRRLFRIVNGGTPTADVENWDGDVKWATPVDLATSNGMYINETKRNISKTGLTRGSGAVPSGSLVISTRAPIGYVSETVGETAFNQGCRGLVPTAKVDIRFYRYQYFALSPLLAARGLGSTFMELSTEGLAAFEVSAPPLEAQQAIVDFLDSETAHIDALIAKKLILLKALEERFRRLVDQATNIGALGALDPAAALPHEWRFPMLRRCFSSIQYGIGEATGEAGTYPVLGMGNIDDHGGVTGAPGGFVDEVDPSLLLRPGDLLFNRTNSLAKVGKVGLVQDSQASMTFASYLVRLRANGLADSSYLNYALNTVDFLRLARSVALPSIGQANLNPARYTELRVPLPPLREQTTIAKELDQERLHLNSLQSRTDRQIYLLRERRQALITAAVTGEMKVAGMSR